MEHRNFYELSRRNDSKCYGLQLLRRLPMSTLWYTTRSSERDGWRNSTFLQMASFRFDCVRLRTCRPLTFILIAKLIISSRPALGKTLRVRELLEINSTSGFYYMRMKEYPHLRMPVSCNFRGCKAPLFRIVSGAILSELALPLSVSYRIQCFDTVDWVTGRAYNQWRACTSNF